MAPKPINWWLWVKMGVAGIGISVGGPLLIMKISPTAEEVRSRYNPDLRARSIEGADRRQQEFDDFVCKLKEYSKSDKPIWVVAREAQAKEKEEKLRQGERIVVEMRKRKEEMRSESLKSGSGNGL